ncbi:MAG: hypothetical protein R3197_16870 [Paracoccaceae bacterium]|nr:hypothetical protein [Paracoccaceae bacterium]
MRLPVWSGRIYYEGSLGAFLRTDDAKTVVQAEVHHRSQHFDVLNIEITVAILRVSEETRVGDIRHLPSQPLALVAERQDIEDPGAAKFFQPRSKGAIVRTLHVQTLAKDLACNPTFPQRQNMAAVPVVVLFTRRVNQPVKQTAAAVTKGKPVDRVEKVLGHTVKTVARNAGRNLRFGYLCGAFRFDCLHRA